MTKTRAIEEMLRWLDEATANGQPVPPDQIADLKDRANYLLDGVVKYLAGIFKIPARYTAVRAPIPNLLGSSFASHSIMPPEAFIQGASGGKSFYIEVSGAATVTVVSDGAEPVVKEVEDVGEFQVIKGNVPFGGGAVSALTITVTSQFPCVVRNVAIYPAAFATDEAVPDYTQYVAYELPDDYREFDELVRSSDESRYPDYRKEGIKTFLLPYDAEGQFEFRYFRNPADVPVDADGNTELEIHAHAAQLVGLKLAVDVCMGVDDTMTIGYYLDRKFNHTLATLMTDDTGDVTSIETVYSMVW